MKKVVAAASGLVVLLAGLMGSAGSASAAPSQHRDTHGDRGRVVCRLVPSHHRFGDNRFDQRNRGDQWNRSDRGHWVCFRINDRRDNRRF